MQESRRRAPEGLHQHPTVEPRPLLEDALQAMTGEAAMLEETGETFDSVADRRTRREGDA
jgi:hypothetical protein